MSNFESNRPLLISVVAPFMMIYGLFGVLYCLSHLGILRGIPELEAFSLFINKAIGKTSVPVVSTLIVSSTFNLASGIGLWSMRKWGAILTLLACAFVFYEPQQNHNSNPYLIGFTCVVALSVIIYFKDFD